MTLGELGHRPLGKPQGRGVKHAVADRGQRQGGVVVAQGAARRVLADLVVDARDGAQDAGHRLLQGPGGAAARVALEMACPGS